MLRQTESYLFHRLPFGLINGHSKGRPDRKLTPSHDDHLKGKPVLRGTQGHPWNGDTLSNVPTVASGYLGINDMALNAPNNKPGGICQALGVADISEQHYWGTYLQFQTVWR